jgi:hypothetical protein
MGAAEEVIALARISPDTIAIFEFSLWGLV